VHLASAAFRSTSAGGLHLHGGGPDPVERTGYPRGVTPPGKRLELNHSFIAKRAEAPFF